jgi:NTE family protein
MAERALVLSGGSIKGAFQAGAIAEVLASGFRPGAIYGTSVGSLNGGFLADRAGRSTRPLESVPWPQIGEGLKEFWLHRITSFAKIGRKRSAAALGWALLTRSFNGLLDMSRLHRLVREEMDAQSISESAAEFFACAVNIRTSDAFYADKSNGDILSYILASTAIPLMMPIVDVGGEPFWDGGVREVAPLKMAVNDGATEVVCIACDQEHLDDLDPRLFRGRVGKQVERLMEMVVSETLANDIGTAQDINTYLEECQPPSGLLAGRHRVNLTVIRPSDRIDVDITNFDRADIARMITLGEEAARAALAG